MVDQAIQRRQLYTAHHGTIDRWWHDDGRFNWPQGPDGHGGFRGVLWQCLSYLCGDQRCVAKANQLIRAHHSRNACHFAPGAAIDVLLMHGERLETDVAGLLRSYLDLHLQYMSTEDLKIHGYNDNHPFKAMHALILGGEMTDQPHLVEIGLHKLRQAMVVYARTGFPCEYNSPSYTPISLVPLAHLAQHARNPEARDLALRLERFFWQDLALHWDPRAGLATGPYSRAYTNDHTGLLSGIGMLLAYLFPKRTGIDLGREFFAADGVTRLLDPVNFANSLPFCAAHILWYASAELHPDVAIEQALFERPAGTLVRGVIESGANAITWADPATRPADAPRAHHVGPRRSLCTTWYGSRHSLGTAQHSWLDIGHAHAFISTIAGPRDGDLYGAATYFARMFFDEHCPYVEAPFTCPVFKEEGESRTVQHESTALVLYNPLPLTGTFKRLRTGIFRPLLFTRPKSVFVGETEAKGLNLTSERLLPVAIDEGTHYVGIIPLRLTDLGNCRKAHLQVLTAGDKLSILISSFENWGPQSFSYEQILETNAGFAFEIRDATDFPSFADFRHWLAQAVVEDDWYASMRTIAYRNGIHELAASYSPYQSAFRFAAIDGRPVDQPVFAVSGMSDPGHGLWRP